MDFACSSRHSSLCVVKFGGRLKGSQGEQLAKSLLQVAMDLTSSPFR